MPQGHRFGDETAGKEGHADGAYQSPSNDRKGIDMVYTGIQGSVPRYITELKRNSLTMKDSQTGDLITATPTRRGKGCKIKSWSFQDSEGKRHDIGLDAIRASKKRAEMMQRPPEELRKRNNVEATIFLLGHQLRNAKTKYRGIYKQQALAYCRCLWINLVRIVNFEMQVC